MTTLVERSADVVVVGGGPAGAATATHLARRGWDVLLLERARFPREKACAEFLSPGVVDQLDRLGALEAVRAAEPAWPTGMRIHDGHSSFLVSYADAPDIAGRPRAALGITRPVFDEILLTHAQASGVRVCEEASVVGLVVTHGQVKGVRVRERNGDSAAMARFVVGADGRHSVVAAALGLDRPVLWPRRLGLVARYAGRHRLTTTGEMFVGRGGYCGLAPVSDGVVNVGLVVPEGAKPSGNSTGAFFDQQIASLPGVRDRLGIAERITKVRGCGPLARRVSRVAGPGYLLVGDAAGFLDPFTGEGVYRALRGGEIAAGAIDSALRRDYPSPEREYTRARRHAFSEKERVCLLVQLFLSWNPLFAYVVRRLNDRTGPATVLSGVLGDYRPAAPVLRPGFLWSALRP